MTQTASYDVPRPPIEDVERQVVSVRDAVGAQQYISGRLHFPGRVETSTASPTTAPTAPVSPQDVLDQMIQGLTSALANQSRDDDEWTPQAGPQSFAVDADLLGSLKELRSTRSDDLASWTASLLED